MRLLIKPTEDPSSRTIITSAEGHILNSMSDALFNLYQGMELAKELWVAMENKYMSEDAFNKNFVVS